MNTGELILALIGSGLISAIVVEAINHFVRKNQIKNEFIYKQVEEFYGPVNILMCESERVFELYDKYHSAYRDEYIGKKWSHDPITRERLRKECPELIELANDYLEIVEENNHKIFELVKEKSHLIDIDQLPRIIDYYEHYIRLNYERDEDKRSKVYFEIQQHFEEISYLPPEVIAMIKQRYEEKIEIVSKG